MLADIRTVAAVKPEPEAEDGQGKSEDVYEDGEKAVSIEEVTIHVPNITPEMEKEYIVKKAQEEEESKSRRKKKRPCTKVKFEPLLAYGMRLPLCTAVVFRVDNSFS